MTIEIFIIFLLFSLILLFYGHYSNIDAYKLIASVLIFVLGTILLPGVNSITDSLEYVSGENTSNLYKYGDNYTGYHWDYASTPPSCPPNNLDCVNLFHVQAENTFIYSTYENHTIGFFLSLAGILSFIIVMVDRRKEGTE